MERPKVTKIVYENSKEGNNPYSKRVYNKLNKKEIMVKFKNDKVKKKKKAYAKVPKVAVDKLFKEKKTKKKEKNYSKLPKVNASQFKKYR